MQRGLTHRQDGHRHLRNESNNPGNKALLQKFIARQLAHPTGWFGRRFTARWLNKANLAMNELTLEQLSTSSEDRILEIGFGGRLVREDSVN